MDVEDKIADIETIVEHLNRQFVKVIHDLQEVKNELQRHYPKSERTKEISDTLL